MDGERLTEYIKKYGDTVYRVAYNLLLNPADSEDVTQEVFIRLYQTNKQFTSEEHIKAWLIRAAINRAKDCLRSRRYRQTEPLGEAAACPRSESGDLAEAIEALDDKYRIAVYLHYYEGYRVRELAGLLGITEANVKTRLKRAREKLKAYLTDE